ncbi:MAG TPA: type II secretion system F family protein [Dehalococcoidia bacterium]|nr:type II secretion system F family protein [Dehalococcoidia bacterium]
MTYKYVAYTAGGEKVEGILAVDSRDAAEEALRRSDMTIADIRRGQGGMAEVSFRGRGSSSTIVVELRRVWSVPTIEGLFPTLYGVKKRDVIVFSRQLATLLSSGIPILAALRLLRDETDKRSFARVLSQVIEDLQRGSPLSDAFSRHPTAFPPVFVRMLEVGEQTGTLEDILRRLADYMAKEEALVTKIKASVAYPAVIIVLAFVVALVFINFVLPGITGLFTEFRSELPLPTRLLLGGSSLVQENFVEIIVVLLVLVGGGLWYSRTPQGRRQIDRALMARIPVIRRVITKGSMARLAAILAMLLSAGLPLTEVMDLLLRATQNVALREALEQVREDVLGGAAMSEALARQALFPSMLAQMVRVGEQTGALAENLQTLARFYEEETDRAVAALTSIIEPALIVAIGGFIAFLAISIISPMYSLLQVVR